MQGIFVVDRNLFARADIAQREKEHVAVNRPHVGIRGARVIDVVRAVASAAAVDTPAAVDITDAQLGSMRAALRFAIWNYFAGIFGNFAAPAESASREATLPVNW